MVVFQDGMHLRSMVEQVNVCYLYMGMLYVCGGISSCVGGTLTLTSEVRVAVTDLLRFGCMLVLS